MVREAVLLFPLKPVRLTALVKRVVAARPAVVSPSVMQVQEQILTTNVPLHIIPVPAPTGLAQMATAMAQERVIRADYPMPVRLAAALVLLVVGAVRETVLTHTQLTVAPDPAVLRLIMFVMAPVLATPLLHLLA